MTTLAMLRYVAMVALLLAANRAVAAPVGELAVRGGLAVHVGADDAKFATEAAATGRWLVLVLARDAAAVEKIRQQVASKGQTGLVTVSPFNGPNLPLADHMANAIVVEPRASIDEKEITRVLVPVRGRAYLPNGKTITKPMPDSMDGWTHFFHSANGNKVSRDTAIRVPNGLRFIAGPRLQDANGANGWRMDDGIAATQWNYTISDKDKPKLVVVEGRDAFNGTLLWQNIEEVHRGGSDSKKTKPFILDDGHLLEIVDDGSEISKIGAFDAETGTKVR
ncbi:MAG: hypothetical protein MI757_12360, partial [Pirellulales bacterium]|nr:hypothetical protein [Pirellulales bacterium]